MSRNDIEELLSERKVPGGTAQRVLDAWDSGDRQKAIKSLDEVTRGVDKYDAFRRIQDASNYILLNELYLSTQASESAQQATLAVHAYSFHVRYPEGRMHAEERADKTEMDDAVRKVRHVFRKDIERSDYSNPLPSIVSQVT